MAPASPPNPYPLNEYAYRQYIAGLKPDAIVGDTTWCTNSLIATYLKHTYGKTFWVEDTLAPDCACYWAEGKNTNTQYPLPEWARLEELTSDTFYTIEEGDITKRQYDERMTRACDCCDTPAFIVDMTPVCVTVDALGMGDVYQWLCAVCMEPHRQAQALHDETQEERITDDE
jgi:hypothetical protein